MLILASGASSVVVAPEYGAALTGWMIGRTPILRRSLPQACVSGNVDGMGCFPLLPYCNRVGRGQFHWRGTDYQLTPNFGDHPHTIHGLGWQRAWTVAETTAASITLQLDHRADGAWPFAFEASVTYSLSGHDMTVTIGLTSRHDAPAPAGIGLHPYFPKAHDPSLCFDATGAWENGPDSLPSQHGAVSAEWQHHAPRPVALSRLDNCFTGWTGTAIIDAGPAGLRIEASEAFHELQVFTPSWADFFCVEPVSHIPDAINRAGLPADQAMHILAPDQTLSGTIRLISTASA